MLKPLGPKKLKIVCINLGASFIKLAQVLATRSDFFSPEYLNELKELHDTLPPMNQKDFKVVYDENFLQNNLFKEFNEEPIASASIGQVHYAKLINGEEVAVKLRRYGIKSQVTADIQIIKFFNTLFRPLFSKYTKNSIESVISEFSSMILQEVSFINEVQNLEEFSSMYKYENIKYPKSYTEYCSDSAIVMSFERGFRFDDKKNIFKNNIDFRTLIKTLVNFYTDQMLIHGYFHADPHPGNLLVDTNGNLIMLDFGMVKRVPNYMRIAIIELLKAANEQNYELYISASKKMGTVAYEAPESELAEFTSRMFTIFGNDNLSSESMQQLAFEVLESTRDLPFKLPSDAIYILRVSAIIEGLGTTYIENFNGIKDILPILQENIPKALGINDSISETIINEIKNLPLFINDFKTSIKKLSEGDIEVEINKGQLEYLQEFLKEQINNKAFSFALLFGGIFILLYDQNLKDLAACVFGFGFLRLIYK